MAKRPSKPAPPKEKTDRKRLLRNDLDDSWLLKVAVFLLADIDVFRHLSGAMRVKTDSNYLPNKGSSPLALHVQLALEGHATATELFSETELATQYSVEELNEMIVKSIKRLQIWIDGFYNDHSKLASHVQMRQRIIEALYYGVDNSFMLDQLKNQGVAAGTYQTGLAKRLGLSHAKSLLRILEKNPGARGGSGDIDQRLYKEPQHVKPLLVRQIEVLAPSSEPDPVTPKRKPKSRR